MTQETAEARHRELERLIGAVIIPEFRPEGGESPDAPARSPSDQYLRRFPPLGLIGFGRRMPDGLRIDGLARSTAALVARAESQTGWRPFVCADLECGAGYHLPGATLLPPARALAAGDRLRPGSLLQAGQLTGLEARAAGIDLVLAPVLDVNTNPSNPIIGVRAFGATVDDVVAASSLFLQGLAETGAGASIKHYPGHGDTSLDSHLVLPRVDSDLAALEAAELAPFERLLAAPVADGLGARLTVMIGHLDVPALTGEAGLPTSLSVELVGRLRRGGFDGVALTDGLAMGAVARLPRLGERCLAAGCDGLLAPLDEEAMAEEILDAVVSGRLGIEVLEGAAQRMRGLAGALAVESPRAASSPEQLPARRAAANAMARAALEASPDANAWRRRFEGQSFPLIAAPGCEAIGRSLAAVAPSCKPCRSRQVEPGGAVLFVAGATILAGHGLGGLAQDASEQVAIDLEEALLRGCQTGLVWFGAPESLPPLIRKRLRAAGAPVLVAFAPSDLMVAAVAAWLAPKKPS